jgi:hypothetical protein
MTLLSAACTDQNLHWGPIQPSGSIATSKPATAARIRDILQDMNAYAFNPQAPPVSGARRPGGLFINWRGTWQGGFATSGANTNIQEDGLSEQHAGSAARHDPLTDLTYLVNLYAYQAIYPHNREFARDVTRVEPIVKQEYSNARYYRCWVYFQLRDLGQLQPGQDWDVIAARFAASVYRGFYDSQAGAIADPRHHGVYRTDYAAECGAMLIDAGQQQHNAAWITAGNSDLARLIQRARNPQTHLFPLQMQLGPAQDTIVQNPQTHLFPLQMQLGPAQDTIVQAQLKMGEEAQLLNSFLDAYDLTGNKSYLDAVVQAVSSLYSPAFGLWDQLQGGFFFSIDANGHHLNAHYKESRQAWMLPLLQHLARIEGGGVWAQREEEMLTVVRDKLWQPGIHGYPYRESPSFAIYQSHNGPGRTRVVEDWVTSEAMGIACESLDSQLLPLTWLPTEMTKSRSRPRWLHLATDIDGSGDEPHR